MVALLVFIIATLLEKKNKLLDTKGPFGGNFSKIRLDIKHVKI